MQVLSSSQYKYRTLFARIQIPLTFRNTLSTVKMQQFAAASLWWVLYYEGHAWKVISLGPKKGRRGDTHRSIFLGGAGVSGFSRFPRYSRLSRYSSLSRHSRLSRYSRIPKNNFGDSGNPESPKERYAAAVMPRASGAPSVAVRPTGQGPRCLVHRA